MTCTDIRLSAAATGRFTDQDFPVTRVLAYMTPSPESRFGVPTESLEASVDYLSSAVLLESHLIFLSGVQGRSY
jgi:hypothetical protein